MKKPSTVFRFTSSLCIAALLSSCASAPKFDAKKELHVSDHWASGRHYIQDNQIVDQASVYAGLKAKPSTEPLASKAQALDVTGRLLGAGGGFAFGYGLAIAIFPESGKTGAGWWIAGGAVGLLIAGILNRSATNKTQEAAGIHNQELRAPSKTSTKKSVSFRLLPGGLALHF